MGLGLTFWEGQFEEDVARLWLRWCDRDGQPILTEAEGIEIERHRADSERQRADGAESKAQLLAERLQAMGINPDNV